MGKMKTFAITAIALSLVLNSCAPYPYYADDGYGYRSNGSEWILPIAAAAIITGAVISNNSHYHGGHYYHGGYGHGGGYGYRRY